MRCIAANQSCLPGQGLGEQIPALVQAPEQLPEVVTEQTPLMQQEPETQGLGEQAEPGWPQMPPPQTAWVETVQVELDGALARWVELEQR